MNIVNRGKQGNIGNSAKGSNNDSNNTKVYVCLLCGLKNHAYTKSRYKPKNVGKAQCWACSGQNHTARDHNRVKIKGPLSIDNKCTLCLGIFHKQYCPKQYCPATILPKQNDSCRNNKFFRQPRTRSGDLTEESSKECHPTNKLSTLYCNELVVQKEVNEDVIVSNAIGHMLPNDDIIDARGHIISDDVIVSNASGHMLPNDDITDARGHIISEDVIVSNVSGHMLHNHGVIGASGHITREENVCNASGHNVSNVDNENVCNASGHNVSNVGNVNVCNVNEKKQVVSQVTNEDKKLTKAEVGRYNLTNNNEMVLNLKYKDKSVSKLFEVSMSLDGQSEVDLLVDTGASSTIIKSSCINKSVLETTKINLLSASGNPLSVKGCMNVNFEAKGESHQMQVVVVDDDTPFKQKGLLGADFLRRTQAILDLDKKTLKFKSVTLPLKERTDVSTNMVSCCQVEYDFDEIKYNAKSVKDVTVYANSQRIIQASVSHNNCKGEAALPRQLTSIT